MGSDFGTFSVQFFVNFGGCFLLPFRVCEALSDELWETAFLKDLAIKCLVFETTRSKKRSKTESRGGSKIGTPESQEI